MYAEKIASTVSEYQTTAQVAQQIQTRSSSKKKDVTTLNKTVDGTKNPAHEYSFQPNLLKALREAKSYNEAFKEVVDPVGAIVPDKLMSIDRPPYKRTGERRRYHRVFTLRVPKLRMFPR